MVSRRVICFLVPSLCRLFASTFLFILRNGFLIQSGMSSLKVPHWYNSCYGYSVSALGRNSAPEIALTFRYLVCRLQMTVAGVFGNCQLVAN